MSGVLKPGAGDVVRPFAAGSPSPRETAPDPRDLELARLRGEVETLVARIEAMETAATEAVAAARAEGRRLGAAEAADRESDRLDALRAGIDASLDAWEARLRDLDGLAAALARAAVAKLFEPHADMAALVTRALARQLETMASASIVTVQVSPRDFADAAAVEALAARMGREGKPLAVAIDPELGAGACRIDCRLEQIDLDVRAQWHRLAALLDDMSGAEEGA